MAKQLVNSFLCLCLIIIAFVAVDVKADDNREIMLESAADDAQSAEVKAGGGQEAVADELQVVEKLADELREDLIDERKRMRMELEDENFVGLAPLVMGTIMGESELCAEYSGKCNDTVHCCQYFGRGKMACLQGHCLQARCGMPNQHCGIFFGDCCFHLGLQCQGNGFRGKCHLAKLWDD